MKKLLLFIPFCFCLFKGYSQIAFEKGYFIDNDGIKTECYIKNSEWKYTPNEFKYQISLDSKVNTLKVDDIEEVRFESGLTYKKFTTEIDRSSDEPKNFSLQKQADFKTETLLLQVLIDGPNTLYQYSDENFERFFFRSKIGVVSQLVYKRYRKRNEKKWEYDYEIGENNRYKQQLTNDFLCENLDKYILDKLKYTKESLVNYFVKNSQCLEQDFTNYAKKSHLTKVNFKLRPGLIRNSTSIYNSYSFEEKYPKKNSQAYRIGIEAEFLLPFNKNKWAIIAEPTFHYFKSDTESLGISYKSIEIPLGFRYYIFLKENSKLFFNANYVLDFEKNSVLKIKTGRNIDISSMPNYALGAGYSFLKKYSLEVRYGFKRDILTEYIYWASEYKTLSIILGYQLGLNTSKQ
ncbi:hypothetical protein [Arcticibacterium luteifluviistationis]|uniref:Outer membrane protein beta-barrel domain-containing protein n=1 Tax=Arcticibacterium luteifluviistationis TaxID=1784714 RepID=A0A2Z4G7U7_9BACT|nr:hypothetical protein [Arcticibacterium luteifluviistationis]AWV97180.1 hypothetical protein DJ013_02915 [Arcticibacterium luteifluviistationis]